MTPSRHPNPESREYDRYLGIFGVMGIALGAISFFYVLKHGDKINFANFYTITTGISLFSTVAVSFLFSREKYAIFSENGKTINLNSKKRALLVVFTSYLIGLSFMTSWDGGAKSSGFTNILILTATLCPFIAKRKWTKAVVGILTFIAYAVTFHIYYNGSTKVTNFDPPNLEALFYCATAGLAVMVSIAVSIAVSKAEEQRQV